MFTDLLDRIGLVPLLRRIAASRTGLVLALNRVLPRAERGFCYDPGLVVTEPAFIALLKLLEQHYEVVHLEELLANPCGRSGRAKVALTFDDGWEDTYRVAFPHLLASRIPATIFACTDLVGTAGLLPEERFARLWSQCYARMTIDALVSDLSHWGMGKRRSPGKRPQRRYWAQELKRMPLTGRLLLLDHFEQRYEIAAPISRRFLNWSEIRTMMGTGLVRMGSHTSRHATLTSESDRDIRRELAESRKTLWQQTGVAPEILTYPNGRYNKRVLDVVRSAGFHSALTGDPGLVSERSLELSIPRIAVRAAVEEIAAPPREFSSSRASVYFLSSWVRSAVPYSATGVVAGVF